jgi:hypothetical protein
MRRTPLKLVITCALAAVLLAGCLAKRDMDECRKGDRSRCPGDASDFNREARHGSSAILVSVFE